MLFHTFLFTLNLISGYSRVIYLVSWLKKILFDLSWARKQFKHGFVFFMRTFLLFHFWIQTFQNSHVSNQVMNINRRCQPPSPQRYILWKTSLEIAHHAVCVGAPSRKRNQSAPDILMERLSSLIAKIHFHGKWARLTSRGWPGGTAFRRPRGAAAGLIHHSSVS